jgi:uncharacterized phage protein gp47/JayE
MAFQLKDFVSIVAAMINRAKATQTRLTDFEIGSVARTLMEAPAIEIEQLYQRMFAGIMDAIPVSIYRGFNFAVADPVKARGRVIITFGAPLDAAVTVPAGTIFVNRTTTQRYLAVNAVTAAIGATTASVLVEAERVGSTYNVGPGQITLAANLRLPVGATMTNTPVLTGSDGESDEERAARFLDYIKSISRGTAFSVRYAAGTAVIRNEFDEVVEYVSRVDLVETPGFVQVYVYGADALPTTDLIMEIRKIIDGYFDQGTGAYVSGYRPVGVDVDVLPMTEQLVSLTATIGAAFGYTLADVSSAVEESIGAAISAVVAGDTLYVDALRNAALSVPGVASALVSTTTNLLCPANIVLKPGTITVAEAA